MGGFFEQVCELFSEPFGGAAAKPDSDDDCPVASADPDQPGLFGSPSPRAGRAHVYLDADRRLGGCSPLPVGSGPACVTAVAGRPAGASRADLLFTARHGAGVNGFVT